MYLDNFIIKCTESITKYPEAMSYLENRCITIDDIHKYGIGFTKFGSIGEVDSEDYTYMHDKTYGFKYLRDRLIMPLRNMLGHVNGIVTRELHNDGRRYVIYLLKEAKSVGGFFGLYEALPYIQSTRKVFIHEGAIDSMSFAKVFPNSISTLTSFINEQQYELLDLLVDKIILVFDNDKAGDFGIKKMKELYGSKKIETITLGDGDPNDYLRMKNIEDFRRFITAKVPLMLRS